jgi:peptidyl-prolyl cis-trans isomerase NIMA-interacting 1
LFIFPLLRVRVRHLLVKHRESRRPSSWKEPHITRTIEDALALIEGFREQIASGRVSFEDLAARESHCNSARAGGDLGFFTRGKMQPPFEKVSFALQVRKIYIRFRRMLSFLSCLFCR